MIKKLDHITFAVYDRSVTGKRMANVYGGKFLMSVESKEKEYVCDMYLIPGDIIIGLLQPTSENSFVSKHLDKYGESLQHIGIDVEDLDVCKQVFADNGIKFSPTEEVEGVRREVLISARNAFGAIVQVMDWLGEYKTTSSKARMEKVWSELQGKAL